MKYMGSKARIAKYILPIILKDRKPGQWYVEPFVGGANMIDKVDGNRIGADINKYVIEALTSIRDHIDDLPVNNKQFTELEYGSLRTNDTYPHKGYAGFAFSYGGKWLGGWCRDSACKRDYVAEAFRNAKDQSPKIKSVIFTNKPYAEIDLPDDCIIYCDPPYAGTTKYKDNFDHHRFWQWCREKKSQGHSIFISEYNAPEDFICIKTIKTNTQLGNGCNTGNQVKIEKLFTL